MLHLLTIFGRNEPYQPSQIDNQILFCSLKINHHLTHNQGNSLQLNFLPTKMFADETFHRRIIFTDELFFSDENFKIVLFYNNFMNIFLDAYSQMHIHIRCIFNTIAS